MKKREKNYLLEGMMHVANAVSVSFVCGIATGYLIWGI